MSLGKGEENGRKVSEELIGETIGNGVNGRERRNGGKLVKNQ